MKHLYHTLLLVLPVGRKPLLILYGLLFLPLISQGQSLVLSLSATNNAPNNCNARTISVSVSGGSGNYAYFWSSSPSSSVNLGNGPSITVSPAVATTFTVAVRDNSNNQYTEKAILVSPLLTGSFSVFMPNAFLEGNLWRVLDANKSTGPLNAYRYELSIINDWGTQVYAASGTVSSGTTGLLGGEISWNGRLNGTGNYVQAGNYFFDLRMINCSANKLYKFTVTFFRPLVLSVEVYPNPAASYVELDLMEGEPLLTTSGMANIQAEVTVLTMAGSPMLMASISNFPARLDVGALPEGEYVLVLQRGGRTIKKHLLIKR